MPEQRSPPLSFSRGNRRMEESDRTVGEKKRPKTMTITREKVNLEIPGMVGELSLSLEKRKLAFFFFYMICIVYMEISRLQIHRNPNVFVVREMVLLRKR